MWVLISLAVAMFIIWMMVTARDYGVDHTNLQHRLEKRADYEHDEVKK